MQDAFVQAIRYKLQKRVRRLNSADYQDFPMLLRVFFHFFDNSPILSGVRDELMARVSEQDVPATVDRILKGQAVYGTTEAESAAMGYCLLKKIAEEPDYQLVLNVALNYHAGGKARDCLEKTLGADSGDSAQGNELTLVGIADPLAQAGGGAVTRAAASLTAQGIAPAPKPGLSGAAALDARGRFAGMVSLNPSVVAGSGGTVPAAALVPAETVRAFLQEHHISPATAATGATAVEQSVLRVICVRK